MLAAAGERLLSRARGAARGRPPGDLHGRGARTRRRSRCSVGARALLYPVQAGESFGLVLAEAAACGTPVAALRRGAVPRSWTTSDRRGVRLTRRAGRRSAAGAGARSRGACAPGRRAVRRSPGWWTVPDALRGAWPRITGRGRETPDAPTRRRSIAARGLRPSRRRVARGRRTAGAVRGAGSHSSSLLCAQPRRPRSARRSEPRCEMGADASTRAGRGGTATWACTK